MGLRNAAYEALMELIKNSPKDCYLVVKETTLIVLKKMEELMNVEATLSSATDRAQLRLVLIRNLLIHCCFRDLISQLCAMLQSVLRKFHETDAIAISEPIMRALFQIMNRYQGKDNGAVMEEALMAVSALVSVLKVNFSNFMPAFKPILMQALSNYTDKDVCINAMGVITDLCTALENNVSAYSDEFIQCLVNILNVSNRIYCLANFNFFKGSECRQDGQMFCYSAVGRPDQRVGPSLFSLLGRHNGLRLQCCRSF